MKNNNTEPKILNFSTNWNNKLELDCFPTIRILNSKKYVKGESYVVMLKEQVKGVAELIHITPFTLDKLTDGMCYIDTGYSKDETYSIIRKMYREYTDKNGKNSLFGFYIFKYTQKQPSLL